MTKCAIYLFTFLLVGGCTHTLSREDALMRTMESQITLPDGAAPLRRYRRYYAWANNEYHTVVAIYVLGGKSGRLWLSENDMPIVLDGGCTVVNFTYYPESKRISSPECN